MGIKSTLNEFFFRLSAFLFGFAICIGSCYLTCRHITLNDSIPSFSGFWYLNPDALLTIAKVITVGIGISTAQVYGAIVFRKTHESKWLWMYVIATVLSIFISAFTFYTSIERGAVQGKYSTEEYQTLLKQKEFKIQRLKQLVNDKTRETNELYSVGHKTSARLRAAEYDKRIEKQNDQIDKLNDQIIIYQQSTSKNTVTVENTYKNFSKDFLFIFGVGDLPTIEWFAATLKLGLLLFFAAIPDLVGPWLLAYGYVPGKNTRPSKEEDITLSQRMMQGLWYGLTGQNEPPKTVDEAAKERDKLLNTPLNKMDTSKLKGLVKDAPSITDYLPTLETRIYLVAPSGSGKTVLMQWLIRKMLQNGEFVVGRDRLVIMDPKPSTAGKWPTFAELVGTGYKLEPILAKYDELNSVFRKRCDLPEKERGKQPKYFVIQDEVYWCSLEAAKDPYKIQFGDKYSFLLTQTREFNMFFIAATQLSTALSEGTKGQTGVKRNYEFLIEILYDKAHKFRCARMAVSGLRPEFYRIPHMKGTAPTASSKFSLKAIAANAKTHAPTITENLRKTISRTTGTQVVRERDYPDKDAPFSDGESRGGTQLVRPSVPAQYYYENDQKVPDEKCTTDLPGTQVVRPSTSQSWVGAYSNIVTELQEEAILAQYDNGASHNNIIKNVFNSDPSPKTRKMLKAILIKNNKIKEK